jgi:hypothetical protein
MYQRTFQMRGFVVVPNAHLSPILSSSAACVVNPTEHILFEPVPAKSWGRQASDGRLAKQFAYSIGTPKPLAKGRPGYTRSRIQHDKVRLTGNRAMVRPEPQGFRPFFQACRLSSLPWFA